MKSNLEYNYTFSIDLTQNGIPFDAKLIGKMKFTIQIWFNCTFTYALKKIGFYVAAINVYIKSTALFLSNVEG